MSSGRATRNLCAVQYVMASVCTGTRGSPEESTPWEDLWGCAFMSIQTTNQADLGKDLLQVHGA